MDTDWIVEEMDAISSSVYDMAAMLMDCDEWALYECVNDSALIVAERLEVEPAFRGSALWRELFALSLRHSIEQGRDLPAYGYLKAFPLQFENNMKGDKEAFAEASKKLQQLYAVNLSAEQVPDAKKHGSYMRFPVGEFTTAN
jgi:hypothetical protein